MTDLQTLAEQARDAGMAAVDAHANAQWKLSAAAVIRELARRGVPFIGDDVWDLLDQRQVPPPSSLRALGPLMLAAARAGEIRRTGEFRPSVRSHMSPKPLWVGV
jgi:hypothetical protein